MSEVNEQPTPQETKNEAPVVGKVRQAIEKAWEGTKAVNAKFVEATHSVQDRVAAQAHKVVEGAKAAKNEYWEIRHAIQDRLAWHGGGVYKYYVENMDKVTNVMWGSKEPKFGNKVIETASKINTRLKGAAIASGSAAADVLYNQSGSRDCGDRS